MLDLNKIPTQDRIVLTRIYDEYLSACKQHKPFHSPHEAYAVIQEELQETWHLIMNDHKPWAGREAMKNEVVAVGAMAMRFMIDL